MGIRFNPTDYNYSVDLTPAALKWFFEFEISNGTIYSTPLLRMLALAELAWDVKNQTAARSEQQTVIDQWFARSKWSTGFNPDAIGLRAEGGSDSKDFLKIGRAGELPRLQVYRDILRRWYQVNPEDIINMQGLDLAWDDPYKLYKHYLPAWKQDETEIEEDEHFASIQGRARVPRSLRKALEASKFQIQLKKKLESISGT